MQEFTITKGATSQIIPVSIYDSSSTTGAKLAGLAYNSTGLTAYYNRTGEAGSATAITLATATKGTWTSGGFIAIDGTNMPGDYELHLPDAILASGADSVLIQLKGATNMVPVNIKIMLTSVNAQDAVRGGMTALPNANAGAAGGLPTDSTGKTSFNDIAATAIVSGGAINTTSGAVDTVTTLTNLPAITSNWLTAAGIAAGALDGKGDWNIGKTGYTLVQAFPANFADQAITPTTGLVSVGTNNDKSGYSIAGTKTTLDNLNDLSAAQVNTEVDNALNTAIPATPTADSINERIASIDNLTQAGGSGDLAAILGDTADMQPKLGTPATDMSADIAAVKADTAATLVDTGTTLPATLGTPTGADLATDIANVQTDTTNLRNVFKRNTAISNIEFLMIDSTDDITPKTGLTVTGQRSIDGGAFAAVSGTIAEVGSGIYQFDALAADTNGGVITYKFAATGANDSFITIHTTT